jgi:hypothetical protein
MAGFLMVIEAVFTLKFGTIDPSSVKDQDQDQEQEQAQAQGKPGDVHHLAPIFVTEQQYLQYQQQQQSFQQQQTQFQQQPFQQFVPMQTLVQPQAVVPPPVLQYQSSPLPTPLAYSSPPQPGAVPPASQYLNLLGQKYWVCLLPIIIVGERANQSIKKASRAAER